MGRKGGRLPAVDRVEGLLGWAEVLGSAGNFEAAFQIVVFSILTSSSDSTVYDCLHNYRNLDQVKAF